MTPAKLTPAERLALRLLVSGRVAKYYGETGRWYISCFRGTLRIKQNTITNFVKLRYIRPDDENKEFCFYVISPEGRAYIAAIDAAKERDA